MRFAGVSVCCASDVVRYRTACLCADRRFSVASCLLRVHGSYGMIGGRLVFLLAQTGPCGQAERLRGCSAFVRSGVGP